MAGIWMRILRKPYAPSDHDGLYVQNILHMSTRGLGEFGAFVIFLILYLL